MPAKKIEKVVHDGQPTRVAELSRADWLAPARKERTLTPAEERIVTAYHNGLSVGAIVRRYHVHPNYLLGTLLGIERKPANEQLYRDGMAAFNALRNIFEVDYE